LSLEDVFVPADHLIGGVEGRGLKQANEVFGYTRLMVATLGLGGGVAALERAIAYSKERVQFGTPLAEKQGYTHKLLVPHAVQLEAARAYIEMVARRLSSEEENLEVEGSIAKYFTSEAGDATANDAIQAFGGYGYIREFEVEKIKRDVKITTIYEGTSEIQRNIISMFRMRDTVRSKGEYYQKMAEGLDKLGEDCGAHWLSSAIRILNEVIVEVRKRRLNKAQYVMFLLADMMTWCEVGEALCKKAFVYGDKDRSHAFMKAAARLFSREAVEKVYLNGLRIAQGYDQAMEELVKKINCLNMAQLMLHSLKDMDVIAGDLVK
jgi:alkylation response protein AidB-like acyl-CoA dehydrogenase